MAGAEWESKLRTAQASPRVHPERPPWLRTGSLLRRPLHSLGPHQGLGWKPHAVSSQGSGAEGQDVLMFSCRPRVELVAAGSRSLCVTIRGIEVSVGVGSGGLPATD